MEAVLDTNVFTRGKSNPGFDSFSTVPSVLEELESRGAKRNFETLDVEVVSPSGPAVEKVVEESERINAEVSEADVELVALALEREAVLVTDDMDLQNLASHLDVDFESYMGEEIEEERSWVLVCDNCGSEVEGGRCGSCGSTGVSRKPGRYS